LGRGPVAEGDPRIVIHDHAERVSRIDKGDGRAGQVKGEALGNRLGKSVAIDDHGDGADRLAGSKRLRAGRGLEVGAGGGGRRVVPPFGVALGRGVAHADGHVVGGCGAGGGDGGGRGTVPLGGGTQAV